jgi:hypothetical protein
MGTARGEGVSARRVGLTASMIEAVRRRRVAMRMEVAESVNEVGGREVSMAIPETGREAMLTALAQFD